MMTLESPEISSRECKCVIRRVREDGSIEFAVRDQFCTGKVQSEDLAVLGHGPDIHIGREFTAEIDFIEVADNTGDMKTVAQIVPGTVREVLDAFATERTINQLRVGNARDEVRSIIAQKLSKRSPQEIAEAVAPLQEEDRRAIEERIDDQRLHPHVVRINTAITPAASKSLPGWLSGIAGSIGF